MSTSEGSEPELAASAFDDVSDPLRLSSSANERVTKGTMATRAMRGLASSKLRYGFLGWAAFFIVWYLASAVLTLPRFEFVPDPLFLFREWISRDPQYGLSLFTPLYYDHILASTGRVYAGFALAVICGIPLGILLGRSRPVRRMIFPVLAMLRRIPPLAWLPIGMLTLHGAELPVIFVVLLAAFFAIVLHTCLGIVSVDESYLRAAACLGYDRWQTLVRVVVPGALPVIFAGLGAAMESAWFALVGGELVAARSGLGYMIFEAYLRLALPSIFIGMITLGVLAYLSSAIVERIGQRLVTWQARSGDDHPTG